MMQVKLTRRKLFFSVLGLLLFGISADRLFIYLTSEKLTGQVVKQEFQFFDSSTVNQIATEEMKSKYATIIPVISFEYNNQLIYFEGPKASFEFFEEGQEVNVLYQSTNQEIKINSLFTFWLSVDYLPFAIPTLMITAILAFGFLDQNQCLKIVFKKRKISTELSVN